MSSQRDEGEEFFDEFAIADVGEFCDNNLSASPYATEERAEYERALDMLRSGRANLLWTFDPSRAQRDLEVYVKLRRICIETRSYWAYGGRVYDMKDPADRKATARDALEAEGASDTISTHVRRGVRKRARSGQHAGPVPFGYRRQFDPDTGKSLGQVIDSEEKAVVRQIVDWCLDAKPLSWIARELNNDGVRCPRDRRWEVRLVRGLAEERQHEREWTALLARLTDEDATLVCGLVARMRDGESPKELARELNRDGVPYFVPSVWDERKVRNVALSEAAAGIRIHQGEVMRVKVADGRGGFTMKPVTAQWPAIITPGERTMLVALLNDPKRRTRRDGTRVKHWWSGIARCEVCDSGLRRRLSSRGGTPRYRCPAGHVSRDQVRLDAWLTEQALQQLERTDAAELFRVDTDAGQSASAATEARVLRAELEGWKQDAITGRVSRSSFTDIEAGLLQRIGRADARAERAALPPVLSEVIGPDARQAFFALDDVAQQREILRAIMRPRVHRTSRRLRDGLDTATIEPGFLFTEESESVRDSSSAVVAVPA